MGKILLIEPQRILQQAISLTLFPDHEVQVEEAIAPENPLVWKDYHLLIVDAAALRERGRLGADAIRAIQSAGIPALWLEEEKDQAAPDLGKLVVVKKPIDRQAFCSAVNEMLCSTGTGWQAESAGVPSGPPSADRAEFIDLVDVVGEGSEGGRAQRVTKERK